MSALGSAMNRLVHSNIIAYFVFLRSFRLLLTYSTWLNVLLCNSVDYPAFFISKSSSAHMSLDNRSINFSYPVGCFIQLS